MWNFRTSLRLVRAKCQANHPQLPSVKDRRMNSKKRATWICRDSLRVPVTSGFCVCAKSLQSCLTQKFWDPIDCSLPGSSVHGIFYARILEWVAMPSSRGYSQSCFIDGCLLACVPHMVKEARELSGVFFYFWLYLLCSVAHTILVPQPGIKPVPRAVEVRSLNHRTTGKSLWGLFFIYINKGTNPIRYFANKSPSSQSYGFSSSHVWMWELDYKKRLSAEELMLVNCGVGEDSWESLGLQGDQTSPS